MLVVRPPIPVRPTGPLRPPGGRPPVLPLDPTNSWTPPPDWWWRPWERTNPITGKVTVYKWPWTDWMQQNSRPKKEQGNGLFDNLVIDHGTVPFDCKIRLRTSYREAAQWSCATHNKVGKTNPTITNNYLSFREVVRISATAGSSTVNLKCGPGENEPGADTLLYRITYTKPDGTTDSLQAMGGNGTLYGTVYGVATTQCRVGLAEINGVAIPDATDAPLPLPDGYVPPPYQPAEPEPKPAERPMAPPVWIPGQPVAPPIAPPDAPQDPGEEAPPRPVPPGQPGRPGTGTGTETGPGQKPGPGDGGGGNAPGSPDSPPTEVPTDKPTPSPPTWPFPPPVTTPKPDPKPDDIPDWQEDFLGEPIGHPSERPPLTAEGTATMLGKLEQKLRVIGNKLGQGPGGGGGGGTDWGDLLQLLGQLLTAPYPAGEYVLGNACKPEQEPVRVPWPAGVGEFSELRARVDALATLINEHKKMGQPVCVKERQGEPVTVILREKR